MNGILALLYTYFAFFLACKSFGFLNIEYSSSTSMRNFILASIAIISKKTFYKTCLHCTKKSVYYFKCSMHSLNQSKKAFLHPKFIQKRDIIYNILSRNTQACCRKFQVWSRCRIAFLSVSALTPKIKTYIQRKGPQDT